ncbi:amino acid ABC transporter permease [Bacillus sp. 03113]|uniref:amino acid ABC transporter permease n=1 Tax=Bacillus sp. 03113 TaxID=2578211 RepID=UPI00114440E6|nr:amino acid ABC transporter permease [Bacillus sp. 03113]
MDTSIIINGFPLLIKGAAVTLLITIVSLILGTVLGYFLCLMRMSYNKFLSSISFIYIWIFRGIPLLILLFLFYYAAPFDIKFSAIQAALIALTLNVAAYKAEYIRSGMLAVKKGQIEAAEAIGLTPFQVMVRIRIPQVIRIIIPPYISNATSFLKQTAQVSVITVPDLMMNAKNLYASTYSPVETLGFAAVLYLFMTSLLMLLQAWSEKKLNIAQNNR